MVMLMSIPHLRLLIQTGRVRPMVAMDKNHAGVSQGANKPVTRGAETSVGFKMTDVEQTDIEDKYRIYKAIAKHQLCSHVLKADVESIRTANTYWQTYGDNKSEIFVYSAFYDDRSATGVVPVLRVLGLSKIESKLYCQVWYNGFKQPYITEASIQNSGRGEVIAGVKYGQHLYTCQLLYSYPFPTHVSMATKECSNSTILLPVYIPIRSDWEHEFGICVAISFGNLDAIHLIEWIELNHMMGVTEINVYNASIGGDMVRNVLQFYQEQRLLIIHQMPPPIDLDIKRGAKLGSPASLNDCMLRNMYRYRYVVIVDFDEVIVPRNASSYTELVLQINKVHKLDKPSPAYIFRNVYYFLDLSPDLSQPINMIMLRYRKRMKPNNFNFAPKSFIDPRRCVSVFNHCCYIKFPEMKETVDVKTTLAMSHHYKKCNFEKKKCDALFKTEQKDNLLLKYNDTLVTKTKNALEIIKNL